MSIKFSIVINTYNRATLLQDALLGLSELNYPDFEVIVVNGPSSDHTDQVLDGWKHKIKIGKCEQPNLSMSRNIGIEMAAGDVIVFIDDDAVPHPTWLDRLAVHYADPKVGGVGGFTIDNTGVTYQVRKTVCDRFGNAHNPSDFFDERPLCFPGSPLYPSLLGTNSSFRATALRQIGGFDHVFAYLLDETDVCLRLVDRGYRVVYEPDALVYHQFAPSHIRNKNRIAKTLYPSAVSKSYFVHRHGPRISEQRAAEEIRRYEKEILDANKWLADHGEITQEHRVSLDDDLLFGIQEGRQRALQAQVSDKGQQGDLDLAKSPGDFFPMARKSGLRIALVSRSFPPAQEAGIARWTWMMADGLARRGHKVHVITLASPEPYTRFENGYWVHAVAEDRSESAARAAALKDIPAGLAPWCIAVERQVRILKGFGLDVVSFPIWDVEGMAIVGDDTIGVVMSLHTSYAMARPFKPEWTARPLFGHFHVDRVIRAEARLLQDVPCILANSEAIVDDLTQAYSVDFRSRTVIAPHGTDDPVPPGSATVKARDQRLPDSPLRITYVGRFEPRKGFDLACAALVDVLKRVANVEICLVGDVLNSASEKAIRDAGAESLLSDPRVRFKGTVTRQELNRTYLSSDVVLMPSRYESFGLVAIEAMAAGAPVIALSVGGLKEVVEDGQTGFLVSPEAGTVNGIVDRLERLAQNPELLRTLQVAARKAFIDKFTIAHMVEAAEKIYFQAAKRQA